MACQLVGERREGKGGVKKGEGYRLTFTQTFNFLVVADSKNVSREEVLLTTPGLPVVGLLYGPLNLVCSSKDAERDTTNPKYWHVTCEFETGTVEQQQSKNQPNSNDPTTWVPVFKVDSFLTKERVITVDQTGTDIKNTAGQPFDTPLVKKMTMSAFSFVQFENPSLKLKDIMARNNCVNKNLVATDYPARTLLLEVQEAEFGYFGSYNAWRIKYRCIYDPDTHDEVLLNVGSFYKSGGTLTKYMDDQTRFPVVGFLDNSGGKTTTLTTKTFRVYKEIAFEDFIRTA